MKLLLCKSCLDVLKLHEKTRFCYCGESGGRLTDSQGRRAVIWGENAETIGIANSSIVEAISENKEREESGFPTDHQGLPYGSSIDGWIIPSTSPAVIKEKEVTIGRDLYDENHKP